MKLFYMINKLLIFIVLAGVNLASAGKDVEHFLVSGPKGYKIASQMQVTEYGTFSKGEFGEFICENRKPCPDTLPGFKGGKFSAEGKVSRIQYRNDDQPAGALAVIRSYESEFTKIGGKKLTSNDAPLMGTHLFYVTKNDSQIWMILDTTDRSTILTFLEQKNMEQLVTAGQLSDQIQKQGFANLNVNFDTNKSNIKDGDKAAINEVVTLLKNDTKLKLSVEGHTDNVGAAAANKSLSQARSDSLVAYMVAAGIPAGRLVAKGFGSEVPVADNRTDEGKAKNRRVELVKIK